MNFICSSTRYFASAAREILHIEWCLVHNPSNLDAFAKKHGSPQGWVGAHGGGGLSTSLFVGSYLRNVIRCKICARAATHRPQATLSSCSFLHKGLGQVRGIGGGGDESDGRRHRSSLVAKSV